MYSEYTTRFTQSIQFMCILYARYETSTCVNVVNSDNVGMSTVVHFIHYIFNILSSDYCSVLKLHTKFEVSSSPGTCFSKIQIWPKSAVNRVLNVL